MHVFRKAFWREPVSAMPRPACSDAGGFAEILWAIRHRPCETRVKSGRGRKSPFPKQCRRWRAVRRWDRRGLDARPPAAAGRRIGKKCFRFSRKPCAGSAGKCAGTELLSQAAGRRYANGDQCSTLWLHNLSASSRVGPYGAWLGASPPQAPCNRGLTSSLLSLFCPGKYVKATPPARVQAPRYSSLPVYR